MAHDAVRTLLPYTGWSDGRLSSVTFTGSADPVLPTPFRIGAAGAAAASETRRADVGNPTLLGATLRSARLSLSGMARARCIEAEDQRAKQEG